MSLLQPQVIDADGLTPQYFNAAAGGDTCVPGGHLHYKNASGSPITGTLVTPDKVLGRLDIQDQTFTIPAGGEQKILVGDEYRNPSTGLATVTYSGVTTLTVGYFR